MEPQNKPQNPLSSDPSQPTPTQSWAQPSQGQPPRQPGEQAVNELLSPAQQPPEYQPDQPGALQTVASGFKTVFVAFLSWIVFPFAVVLILHNFVFQAYHVLGTSMVPTLHETDYLIVSKLGDTQAMIQRALGKNIDYIPARGEIIVFHFPGDPSKVFVKRVVGLPGDRVVIKNGAVTVFNASSPNGFDPDAKYEPSGSATLIDTDETVKPGNVFVLGDNRTPGGSYDSREWGQLESSYIIGDAVLRLLPLKDTKVF